VARAVAARAMGQEMTEDPTVRSKVAEAFTDKIVEWIERSNGWVRADVVHEKLVAMGYRGSERTTRRVVAALKKAYEHEHRRVYKPWITEPGAWLQYDFGAGPVIDGLAVVLFCAWLAWSRFRVILPLSDRSLPSVIAALDRTFRLAGGAPTFVLTDNEKTVTDRHIAGIAVRNQVAVDVSRYYGVTIATCVPADPESKGIVEHLVGYAKSDLVVPQGLSAVDLPGANEAARVWCAEVNGLTHTEIVAVPAERLVAERDVLRALPSLRPRIGRVVTRKVDKLSCVRFGSARYSVPNRLIGRRLEVLADGARVKILDRMSEIVADHLVVLPGEASIVDDHYGGARPPQPRHVGRCDRSPRRRRRSAPWGRWPRRSSREQPRPG
jgi:transposase